MGVIFKNGISYSGGGENSGGTSNYAELINKPRVNGVALVGNKSSSDLKLNDGATIYINDDNEMAVGVISSNQIDSLFNQ